MKQRSVLEVWIAATLVLGVLWVPWENIQFTAIGNVSTGDLGYAPLFSPPSAARDVPRLLHEPGVKYPPVGLYSHARLDQSRVLLELGVVTLLAGGLLLLLKNPSKPQGR